MAKKNGMTGGHWLLLAGTAIVLAYCLYLGCDQTEKIQPDPAAALNLELIDLQTDVAEIKANMAGVVDTVKSMQERQQLASDHSVLTAEQQQAKFAADYPAVFDQLKQISFDIELLNVNFKGQSDEINKLINEPKSCPAQPLDPVVAEMKANYMATKSKPAATCGCGSAACTGKPGCACGDPACTCNGKQATTGRFKTYFFKRNGCKACDSAWWNAVAPLQYHGYVIREINVDSDPQWVDSFKFGTVPTIAVYDPAANRYSKFDATGLNGPQVVDKLAEAIGKIKGPDAPPVADKIAPAPEAGAKQ